MSGLLPGLGIAALAAASVGWLPAWEWWLRRRARQAASAVPRRRATGRVRVDPQYVREQFAEIVARAPRELRRPDPRLYALYVVPSIGETRD